jgi:Family of unknown function (DUF6496)
VIVALAGVSQSVDGQRLKGKASKRNLPLNRDWFRLVVMPIKAGKSRKVISKNIRELKSGPQYKETRKTHGKKVAHKQAVAIALEKAREAGANIPRRKKKS